MFIPEIKNGLILGNLLINLKTTEEKRNKIL